MRRTKRTHSIALIYADLTAIGDAPIGVCVAKVLSAHNKLFYYCLWFISSSEWLFFFLETLSSMSMFSAHGSGSCYGNFHGITSWVGAYKCKLVAPTARKTKWTFIKINHHRAAAPIPRCATVRNHSNPNTHAWICSSANETSGLTVSIKFYANMRIIDETAEPTKRKIYAKCSLHETTKRGELNGFSHSRN